MLLNRRVSWAAHSCLFRWLPRQRCSVLLKTLKCLLRRLRFPPGLLLLLAAVPPRLPLVPSRTCGPHAVSLQAREAYAAFMQRLAQAYRPERVFDGVFGAMMDVSLVRLPALCQPACSACTELLHACLPVCLLPACLPAFCCVLLQF